MDKKHCPACSRCSRRIYRYALNRCSVCLRNVCPHCIALRPSLPYYCEDCDKVDHGRDHSLAGAASG